MYIVYVYVYHQLVAIGSRYKQISGSSTYKKKDMEIRTWWDAVDVAYGYIEK